MAKDKANGDGTSADVHLVSDGTGGVGKVVVATCLAKSLRCIDAVLTANGISDPFFNEANSISNKCGVDSFGAGTAPRLRGCIPVALEWGTIGTRMS